MASEHHGASLAIARPSLVWGGSCHVIFFSTRGVINGPSSIDPVRNWLFAVASLWSLC